MTEFLTMEKIDAVAEQVRKRTSHQPKILSLIHI